MKNESKNILMDIYFIKSIFSHSHGSGQIIVTSHEFSPQNVPEEGKWDLLFQGNLGEGEIL